MKPLLFSAALKGSLSFLETQKSTSKKHSWPTGMVALVRSLRKDHVLLPLSWGSFQACVSVHATKSHGREGLIMFFPCFSCHTQGMSMNSYTNFVQCPHSLRESKGREPLQAAFDTCKFVG